MRYRPDKYRLVYAALFAKEFKVAKQLYFAPYSKYAPQTTVQALRNIYIYCYTNYLYLIANLHATIRRNALHATYAAVCYLNDTGGRGYGRNAVPFPCITYST